MSYLKIIYDTRTHQGAALWSKGGLGMSHKLRHSGFDSALGVLLDYLIHGSGG
jgi:hypothetical protein